jgi:hypothetical protein
MAPTSNVAVRRQPALRARVLGVAGTRRDASAPAVLALANDCMLVFRSIFDDVDIFPSFLGHLCALGCE